MSKLSRPAEKNVISKSSVSRGGNCPQIPAFSFTYLTKNSSYNLDYFSDENDRRIAIENIYERLVNICQKDWKHWHLLPKQIGLEMFPADEIRFSPSELKLTPDEKVIVFRTKSYAGREARILGIREDSCPIYFIIGYDFNFTAYNHG